MTLTAEAAILLAAAVIAVPLFRRAVLEALGLSRTKAEMTVERFTALDAQTLLAQAALKGDEDKLKASAREAGRQLEQLFEADAESATKADESER